MTTLEILTAARALVARGWCQLTASRDEDGQQCSSYSAHATRFCLWGAVTRNADTMSEKHAALDAMRAVIPSELSLSAWNDAPGRTQAEVVDAFTRAIELARKEQIK